MKRHASYEATSRQSMSSDTDNISSTQALVRFSSGRDDSNRAHRSTLVPALLPITQMCYPDDEAILQFTMKYLFKDQGPLARSYRNAVSQQSTCAHRERSLMSHCAMALAKVFYGLKKDASMLLRDGISLYGTGLSMLNDTLDRKESRPNIETIISIVLLSMTEVIVLASS